MVHKVTLGQFPPSVSPVSIIPPAFSTHRHLGCNVAIRTSGWIVSTLTQNISLLICRGVGVRQEIYTFCSWDVSKMARTYLQPSAPNRILYTPDPSQSALFVVHLCRSCKLLHATSSRHHVHPLVRYVTSDVCCWLCQHNLKTTSGLFCSVARQTNGCQARSDSVVLGVVLLLWQRVGMCSISHG